MAKRKAVEVNTYFDGKPDWFRGYAETIAKYVVENQRMLRPGSSFEIIATPASIHFAECGIKEIWSTDEEASMESQFDSFGNGDYASCFVSVVVSCNCGEYGRFNASIESTISEVISSALFVR